MTQNHLFFETPGPQPLQVVLPQTQGTKAQYDKTKGTKQVSKRKMYDESLGNIFFSDRVTDEWNKTTDEAEVGLERPM